MLSSKQSYCTLQSFRMWRNSFREKPPLSSSMNFATTTPFKGRATVKGTSEFVMKSELSMHHIFKGTALVINPIIHGPPKRNTYNVENQTYMEALTRRAVVVNRSNCMFAYQHYDDGSSWHATNLRALFSNPANDISREQIVVIAHIGLATTRDEVFKRLFNACQNTGLQMIDMVVFEVKPIVTVKSILADSIFVCTPPVNRARVNVPVLLFNYSMLNN